jgi:glutathione S-transferase
MTRPAVRSRCSKAGRSWSIWPRRPANSWRRKAPSAGRRWNGPSGRSAAWVRWPVSYGYFAIRAEEKVPAAITRFGGEVARLLGVLDRRLNDHPWIAGEHYSIADIASYSWTRAVLDALAKAAPDDDPGVPAVENWLMAVEARPAVQQGMGVPKV